MCVQEQALGKKCQRNVELCQVVPLCDPHSFVESETRHPEVENASDAEGQIQRTFIPFHAITRDSESPDERNL